MQTPYASFLYAKPHSTFSDFSRVCRSKRAIYRMSFSQDIVLPQLIIGARGTPAEEEQQRYRSQENGSTDGERN